MVALEEMLFKDAVCSAIIGARRALNDAKETTRKDKQISSTLRTVELGRCQNEMGRCEKWPRQHCAGGRQAAEYNNG